MTVGAAVALAAAASTFWLGPSYRGLDVSVSESGSYLYGDCEPESDSGCAPPYQVQSRATCERNPLALDILPRRLVRIREGGIAAVYGGGLVDVGTGRRTVSVFAPSSARAVEAARRLRRRSERAPHRLARPVYPRPVLRELKRTAVEPGLSRAELRLRRRMASLLGEEVMRGVRAPSRPWRAVKRDRGVRGLSGGC